MKVKAIWKSINPFVVDVTRMSYSKTIDIPDDTDMYELKEYAIEDSRSG